MIECSSLLLLGNSLLLLSHDEEVVGLSTLGAEVGSVGEQAGKVDHLLVNQHASDSASILTEVLFDDGIYRISNEVLSLIRVGDLVQISDRNLRKREVGELRNGLSILLLAVVVRTARAVTSLATAVATSVTSVSATYFVASLAISTLVATLSVGAREVRLDGGETKEGLDDLLGLSLLLALLLLFLLLLGDPHLN